MKLTEDRRILRHIRQHGSITPLEALRVAGCLAMHSAAARLRLAGHRIVCKMQSKNGKRFGSYSLRRK